MGATSCLCRGSDGKRNVWRMNLDGSNPHAFDLRFGGRVSIVFARQPLGCLHCDLRELSRRFGRYRLMVARLFRLSDHVASSVSVSPDGRFIALLVS